ncbi:hypothetical protein [Desulfovibrio sp.]
MNDQHASCHQRARHRHGQQPGQQSRHGHRHGPCSAVQDALHAARTQARQEKEDSAGTGAARDHGRHGTGCGRYSHGRGRETVALSGS